MAVLARMTASGMDEATYDQISAHLTSLMKNQPGFTMHLAYPAPGGFYVEEIWESRAPFKARLITDRLLAGPAVSVRIRFQGSVVHRTHPRF
jgi:hypothetical protein